MRRGRDDLYGFSDLERLMNNRIEILQTSIEGLTTQVTALDNAVNTITNAGNYAGIINLIDNSWPEWSKAAYTTLGVLTSTVTDANREAYNWFRQLRTDTALAATTTNALKGVGHSMYAANEGTNLDIPRWDITKGQVGVGGVTEQWDICIPIPSNLVFPGLVFYIQFEAMLATSSAMPQNLQFFAGFWDNTAGQQKYIEGGNFTITGEVFGVAGSQTVRYQVKAYTDSGEEAISNVLTFTNAPAVFDQNNHLRINFRGAPGFIKFEIYREIGGVYTLQGEVRNAIESTFFDVGNPPIRTVAGFPSPTATAPRAYAKTARFLPGTIGGTGFVRHTLTVVVPTTYDSSVTDPDQQWLRMGLSELCTDANQIVIRKLGVSLGDGMWARSANDNMTGVRSSRTSTPSSSDSGGSGSPVGPPPPGGSGDCVLLDTPIDVYFDGQARSLPLRDVAALCGMRVIYAESGGKICGIIRRVRIATANTIYHIRTENGHYLPCTVDHPIITSKFDTAGTPASRLKVGDTIETRDGASRIVSMDIEYGTFEVGITEQDGEHLCILGGVISHNRKPLPDF